ncbi:MAG TPA: hypothetical protein VF578_22230 [Methylomirabilota bacterium]
MLRLKGEPDDSMADGAADEAASGEFEETFRDHPAFDSRSLPDSDDFEDDGPREGGWSILSDTRGLAIAAAAFVPTFLLVFLGVPYLLEDPSLARTPDNSTVAYARDPQSDSEWSLAKSLSEALRGGPFDRPQLAPPSAPSPPPAPPAVATAPPAPAAPPATPPPPAAPPVASAPPTASPAAPALSATAEAPPAKIPAPSASARRSEAPAALGDEARSREQSGEPMPGTSVSRPSSGSDSGSAAPSLPPPASRVPDPERKPAPSKPVLEPRSIPAPRQAAATPDPPRAQSEARKGASDWTPAAAFADRDAAARLASSIERQGYPVEIRQEASSTRPWVVWIGSQPSGGARRR